MATKPTIPYFAPPEELPAPLPTLEEIFAQEDRISYEMQSSVVRIREHFAVKSGPDINVQEGLNMLFVAQSTSIPVPKVYAIYEHVDKGVKGCVIVMEYIAGKTLLHRWHSLSKDQKREVAGTLRGYVDELRSLPPHGYYGSLWEGPYNALEIVSAGDRRPHPEPEIRGPHKTEEEFCDALYGAWAKSLEPPGQGLEARERFLKRWKRTYRAYFKGDGVPVFTHGDLERVNIMVADDGRIVMIDWEYSGWYPKFWEFCHASNMLSYRDDWGEFLDEVILGTDYDAKYPLFGHHWHAISLG